MNLAHLLGLLFTFGVVGPRPSAGTVESIPTIIAGIKEIEKESIKYSKSVSYFNWNSYRHFFLLHLRSRRPFRGEKVQSNCAKKNLSKESLKGPIM